jgi:hypothetical protein
MKLINRITFQEVTGPQKNFPLEEWLPIKYKQGATVKTKTLPPEPRKYWKIVNETVREMTAQEKVVVDAAEEQNNRLILKEQAINEKLREIAIYALIEDGVLDSNGDWNA